MRRMFEKRDDDRRGKRDCSWFVAIEKRAVLTEVRTFGDPHLDKSKCLPIIKKLLYLLNQGETFTKTEASTILSSVIKLYRFQDVHLRRIFYLVAKELCPIADEVALVTSSILKDISSNNVIYRANAIRLLCWVANGTSPTQIEKWLSEAILDENPTIKSAAFVSASNLLKGDPWLRHLFIYNMNIRPAIRVNKKHVQFHALNLLFQMHQDDMLGLEKLVKGYADSINFRGIYEWCSSPLGLCIMARSITQITRARRVDTECYKYLKSCINHKHKMVAIEGFRSLEELRGISTSELKKDIEVIRQVLHTSPKPVLRFAAFRALQKVGVAHRVVWESPKDYTAIELDVNLKKLYLEQLDHHDKEAPAEVTQVVKAETFAIKEASTHDLRKRLV